MYISLSYLTENIATMYIHITLHFAFFTYISSRDHSSSIIFKYIVFYECTDVPWFLFNQTSITSPLDSFESFAIKIMPSWIISIGIRSLYLKKTPAIPNLSHSVDKCLWTFVLVFRYPVHFEHPADIRRIVLSHQVRRQKTHSLSPLSAARTQAFGLCSSNQCICVRFWWKRV